MGKSKETRTLAYNNTGQELVFDSVTFKNSFDAKEKKINQSKGKSRGGQALLLKELAKCVYPEREPEESIFSIKNWLYGRNGPSCLEDVQKLESFFGCSFLIPRPRPNTTDIGELSSMYENKDDLAERNAARELYQLMTDLIRAHQKAMYYFWCADFPVANETKWIQYAPKDYPVLPDIQHQIWRISFDLPQEVRDDTLRLLEDIYSYPSIPEEKNDGIYYPSMDYDYDDFRAFLRKNGNADLIIGDSGDVMSEWFEFSNSQTEDFYNTLDEIFDAYRR